MSFKNSILASITADSQALGPHWIYDQDAIASAFSNFDKLADPMASYHEGKKAGDFTHYGDQTMILLRHSFAIDWRAFWENPNTKSYRDGATKGTLENLKAGKTPTECASASVDISAVGRIAPLLQLGSPEAVHAAVKSFVGFTHSAEVVQAAAWFTTITLSVATGVELDVAVKATIPASHLDAGKASAASTTSDRDALKQFGLGCKTEMALPGLVHLMLRYPKDGAAAMRANLFAGGDTAARGMILAMVYGAMPNAPSPALASTLTAASEITKLLS
jgi:ADP-ribosylglycohydrolase